MTDNPATYQSSKTLSLIRLKAACKMAPVRVDFEPPHRLLTAYSDPTSRQHRSFPPFTMISPISRLPSSYPPIRYSNSLTQKYYEENAAFQKQQFEEKIQRSVQESTSNLSISAQEDLFVAVPNSNFCQICQQTFDSYYQHINRKLHRTRTQNSTTSTLIEQFCTEFRNRTKKEVEGHKTKGIRKESQRQEKVLNEKKMNKSANRSTKENESLVKGQNFSTCLIQDSLLSFGA